jgi:hypothetical protein
MGMNEVKKILRNNSFLFVSSVCGGQFSINEKYFAFKISEMVLA